MSDRFWRLVFLTAGVFNIMVGLSMAFDTHDLAASAGIETVPYHAFYSPVTGWFIILFGLLYLAVWRDLENRAIVLIGTLGKAGAVVLVLSAWQRGLVPAAMAGLVSIDAIYTALFAAFLWTSRSAAKA